MNSNDMYVWLSYLITGITFFAIMFFPLFRLRKIITLQGDPRFNESYIGVDGYGGVKMNEMSSEPTRLALSSAILKGSRFRRQILASAGDIHRAVSPECSINMRLLHRVCSYMEDREFRYQLVYTVLLPVFPLVAPLHIFKGYVERFRIAKMFSRDVFDEDIVKEKFPEVGSDSIVNIADARQNVVIYKGFLPFAFAGINLGGWSIALDLNRAKYNISGVREAPKKVTLSKLYERMEKKLLTLGIQGLSIRNYLFIPGHDVPKDSDFLPDKFGAPVQVVEEAIMDSHIEGNDSRVRYYKWIRIDEWGGDLTLSMFVRFSITGTNLFVELSQLVLTPPAQEYRDVDNDPSMDLLSKIFWGLGRMLSSPFAALASPFHLMSRISIRAFKSLGLLEKSLKREILLNPLFDFGAKESLRSRMTAPKYINYFQKMDSSRNLKVMEQQILDAIVDVLDEHGVDTSEIKERKSTILNNGILVQHGDVTAQAIAVGSRARAATGFSNFRKGNSEAPIGDK